jgi:hypothetical protein
MTWYGTATIVCRILPNRVLASLADKAASVFPEVSQKVAPLHEAASSAATVTRCAALSMR